MTSAVLRPARPVMSEAKSREVVPPTALLGQAVARRRPAGARLATPAVARASKLGDRTADRGLRWPDSLQSAAVLATSRNINEKSWRRRESKNRVWTRGSARIKSLRRQMRSRSASSQILATKRCHTPCYRPFSTETTNGHVDWRRSGVGSRRTLLCSARSSRRRGSWTMIQVGGATTRAGARQLARTPAGPSRRAATCGRARTSRS